jgi:hypothetical protein
LRESPVPVEQQRAGQFRDAQVQQGEDEQLVPEDVPAVALRVQAPRGHPGIQVGGVPGQGLRDVEQMQVHGPPGTDLLPVVVTPADVDLEGQVQPLPQVFPRQRVRRARRGKSGASASSPLAASNGSEIALSREVKTAAILSTVTGTPDSTGTVHS